MQHPSDDSASALKTTLETHPQAWAYWQALSPSHQNEYLKWIGEAKKAATRQRRIEQTVQRLLKKSGHSIG